MGRGGAAIGPHSNPGTPFFVGLPKWPGCCLVQHSNLALGHGPELRDPEPLRCGEGNGHPEQCVRKWLHAHENHETRDYIGCHRPAPLKCGRGQETPNSMVKDDCTGMWAVWKPFMWVVIIHMGNAAVFFSSFTVPRPHSSEVPVKNCKL